MANTVNQASNNPTNKLTAVTVSGAIVSAAGLIVKNLAPEWYDPELLLNLSPIVLLVVGWFIKDNPNIVVVVEDNSEAEVAK